MKLPERKLGKVESFRTYFAQTEHRKPFGTRKMKDSVTVHYEPTPVVGKWAEWGIFYYLFGWLRLIKTEESETFTFARFKEPTSHPTMYEHRTQPAFKKLVEQLENRT